MNSNKKENIAITALINEINKFDNLEESLKKRDKEPVWDGDIYLYKKDSSRKSDIVGRIPVQIKGTSSKIKDKKGIYYDVELIDIENYKKDNKGAIFFIVEIDEKILESEVRYIKNKDKNQVKDKTLLKYDEIPYDKQVKYIKEKFEKGVSKEYKREDKIDIYYYLPDEYILSKAYNNWWGDSFFNSSGYTEYEIYKLHIDFFKQNKEYSLLGLAKQYIKYLLYERNHISKEAENLLKEIIYENFSNGKIEIDEKLIINYKNKFPKLIKELFDIKIITKYKNEYRIINYYIYLYIAVNELIKRRGNLLEIIYKIKDDESNSLVINKKQKIFQLYSKLNTKEFNILYLTPALEVFNSDIKKDNEKLDKMQTCKSIIDLIDLEIGLDKEFALKLVINKENLCLDFIEFVTGTDIIEDMSKFDYGIYQEEFFKECYNERKDLYILNFKEILNNEKLKNICTKLKLWDCLYDVYTECEKVLNKIHKKNSFNMYNVSKKYIVKKYFN